jgi:NADH-quinone oxidoreductase subunit I
MPGKSKVIERKPLNLAEKTYLPQIIGGLGVTFKNLMRKKVTMEYPEVKPPIPNRYRGVPALVKDPEGREKCVSCQLCEFVCPPKAITITPGSIPEDSENAHVEKAPQEFEIDMLRCIYCGMCEEACPREAIELTEVYDFADYSREELVWDKEKLLGMYDLTKDGDYYDKQPVKVVRKQATEQFE